MNDNLPRLRTEELDALRVRAKQQIRRQIIAVRRVLPESACAERSARACSRVIEHAEFARARCIVAYVAMRKELDPAGIVEQALLLGKEVGLPRIEGGTLVLHRYLAGDTLAENALQVREPRPSAPMLDPAQVDLVLVPALAIDPRGYRVGYGQGFYDRLLPRLPRAYKIGLGYDFQLIAEAPNAAHDVPVDCLVTDARTLQTER